MTQKIESKIENTEKGETNNKPPLKKRVLGWLGYLAVFGAILFFFAPESWWQFGVVPTENRKTAANFALKDVNGNEWNFADHRGKVVVVNYWATWCPPCRVETPGLVSFADEYKSRGVEVVGVTVDEDLSLIAPFVEKYEIKYPILIAGFDPNISGGSMALPTTFLYDKNGRLAKKYTGIVLESTLKSDANALLAEK
jgi:cytochrome c biogenesis protein CcmG, thiol:disulfide interchange protein DsbE